MNRGLNHCAMHLSLTPESKSALLALEEAEKGTGQGLGWGVGGMGAFAGAGGW